MRTTGALLLAALLSARTACGQVPSGTPVASDLSFSGQGESETTVFSIGNRWEISWMGPPIAVTVETPGNVLVAGSASAGGPGSLFVASGGNYKLHVATNAHFPWTLRVQVLGPAGQAMASSGVGRYVPPDMTSSSPWSGGPAADLTARTGSAPGAPVAYGPGGAPISAPSSPVAPPSAGPAPQLSEAQASAVVLIRGDNAEGTGFLVKTAAGPVVVTNQHVIAANPHLRITTTSGQPVTLAGLQGATDRDLAMIPIQDNHYSYLTLASDVGASVQVGDQVITPGNSEGGEVMLNTNGTVLALGPQKIEISNPIYHGNSGGPIFHVKSGTVIGVVTEGLKVDTTDALDQASFQNHASAITGQVRYFGLRLDNVPAWEPYTWARFENETTFLNQFEERSKCLDSYLNTASNDSTPWGLYYLRDDKIRDANQAANSSSAGADTGQQIDGERALVFSLDAIADSNMDQIAQPSNFYQFDQLAARDQLAYRTSLKKEIADMSSNVERIGRLARTNSSQ